MPTNTVEPEVFNETTSWNMMYGWTYFGIFGNSKSWQPQHGQCLEALWLQSHVTGPWMAQVTHGFNIWLGDKHPIASYCRVLRVPGFLIHGHMFLRWLLEKWNTDSIMGVRWCKLLNIGRFIVSNQKLPTQWDCNHQPQGTHDYCQQYSWWRCQILLNLHLSRIYGALLTNLLRQLVEMAATKSFTP